MMDKILQKNAFKSSQVSEKKGVLKNVSLIQQGEAKGHGVYVDNKSLESALAVAPEKIPAFLTHEGALDSDRILKQIGYFSDLRIEDDRLIADRFTALDSFKYDEQEKFNRLFDIAEEMPETFGISLVFTNKLYWVDNEGNEVSVDENYKPQKLKYDMPVVRFVEIHSADFVDEPASNEKGLFKSIEKLNLQKDMTEIEITEKTEEIEEEVVEETALAVEETALSEDEEKMEEDEGGEEGNDEMQSDSALDLLAEMQGSINKLAERLEAMELAVKQGDEKINALNKLNKIGLLKAGTKAIQASQPAEPVKKISIKDQFMSLNGQEAITFRKENKALLQKALRAN